MRNFKRISYLIFAIYILQWPMLMADSASTVGADNTKSTYERSDDKERGVSSMQENTVSHKFRQLRCATCYEDRRYGDDRSRYYSNYAARAGDDRGNSWYYPKYDRYDDRGYRGGEYTTYGESGGDRYGGYRYRADRYGADRYENGDRYGGYRDNYGAARPSYDRYDSRTRDPYENSAGYDRGESRGYSYDNRDRYYGRDRESNYYGRDRYYERPGYGAAGVAGSNGYAGYDRDYYDRYSTRYDFRRYRPWDDTYREQSGYDKKADGYYYPKGNQEDRRYLPEPNYNSPCGIRKPECRYNRPEEETRVTSGPIGSNHYNVGVSQTTYNTNQNDSSRGSGSSAGWSYLREDEQPPGDGSSSSSSGSYAINRNKSNRDRNSDQQSSGYGALLDRGSNLIAVDPVKSNENSNDSMTSSDMQKDPTDDKTAEQSEGKQNS